MNESLQDLATQYVLDQLDERERAAFVARLPHDAELTAFVHELEAALAARIRALPAHEPSPGLLSQIETRIDRFPARAGLDLRRSSARGWPIFARLAAAVVVAALALFAVFRPARPSAPMVIVASFDPTRSTLAEIPLPVIATGADARFMQLASMAQQLWNDPRRLPENETALTRAERGYALFDPGTRQGFVAVRHIPALPGGERYHLWLVDTGAGVIRDAGILPLEASTRGLFFFSLSDVIGSDPKRLGFFITIEDAATHSSAPRGRVVLGHNPI